MKEVFETANFRGKDGSLTQSINKHTKNLLERKDICPSRTDMTRSLSPPDPFD